MCGVAATCGKGTPVERMTLRLAHRGPDDADVAHPADGVALGHTRLSILDLDSRSRCPMRRYNVTLVYNGEMWNYLDLRAELEQMGHEFSTLGDTEVVCAALACWGVGALPRFEGMFAMIWWDAETGTLHAARDRFGEIPLHCVASGGGVSFASELKAFDDPRVAHWVEPGTVVSVTKSSLFGQWTPRTDRWYDAPTAPMDIDRLHAAPLLRQLIERGSRERAISDVPVCTLLSGGIDSSAVAYHLKQELPHLVAYTAVYDTKGPDLKQARIAAEAIGVELVEVLVPVPDHEDLTKMIHHIEMPYKAQVEIAWPCWHLAERMAADGFKVVFSGEGSDELWASYGFTYHAMQRSDFDWHEYRKETFVNQHRKNFARCNKVFMAHGVECRLPFLHTSLVEYALGLPAAAVADGPYGKVVVDTPESGRPRSVPKAIMRDAYRDILPDSITSRKKLAFQDGMGIKKAIAEVIPDPRAFYGATFRKEYA